MLCVSGKIIHQDKHGCYEHFAVEYIITSSSMAMLSHPRPGNISTGMNGQFSHASLACSQGLRLYPGRESDLLLCSPGRGHCMAAPTKHKENGQMEDTPGGPSCGALTAGVCGCVVYYGIPSA